MTIKREHSAAMLLLAGFLLGIHNGYLTVWRDDDPQPLHSFCVREESLPPADRILLRRGIRAADEQTLYALLDDYL